MQKSEPARWIETFLILLLMFVATVGAQALPLPVHLQSHGLPSTSAQPVMFLQPDTWDPILVGVDTNRYLYGGGDPINGSDPSGHDFKNPETYEAPTLADLTTTPLEDFIDSLAVQDDFTGKAAVFATALAGQMGILDEMDRNARRQFYKDNVKEADFKGTKFMDPSQIAFSQSSARASFSDETPVRNIVDGLAAGTVKPGSAKPVRVVSVQGVYMTLDNRRLAAFIEAQKKNPSLKIAVVAATPGDIAYAHKMDRFSTRNFGSTIGMRKSNDGTLGGMPSTVNGSSALKDMIDRSRRGDGR